MLPFQSVVKSSTGKRSARGVRSCQNPVEKHFSDAEEKITPKALKHSVQSKVSFKAIDFIAVQELIVQ